jgi:RNA 3'-terminal phosphate cyclase (ATP)
VRANGVEPVLVDGSFGEGGGQILRTALLLSIVTSRPFEIFSIRAKRPRPGLLPQHVAALKAFEATTESRIEGVKLGSERLTFQPGRVRGGNLKLDVGTAGSLTLILTSLVPALSLAGGDTSIFLTGGTDTKWSPTFDYFVHVICKIYRDSGIRVVANVVRRGYYPRGGGEVSIQVRPSDSSRALIADRQFVESITVRSVSSNLPGEVAKRQAESASALIRSEGYKIEDIYVSDEPAASPGTAIVCHVNSTEYPVYIGGDSVGERGVRAEEVGRRAASTLVECLKSGAALDLHAADIVVPLMALAPGESRVTFPRLTGHVASNIYVSQLFTDRKFRCEAVGGIVSLSTQ